MNIETLINDAMNFVFSDVSRSMWIVASIAVIGAINGIRISIGRCDGHRRGRIL